MLARQVAHHALQAGLGRGVVTAVDAAAARGQGPNEDDAAPAPGLHVRDGELAQDETGAQVDGQGEVELVDGDVEDAGDALAVAGVGNEDVGAVLTVLRLDLVEDALDVVKRGNVALVHRHFGRGPLGQLLEVRDEGVYGVLVARVGDGEIGAVEEEIASAGAADTGPVLAYRYRSGKTTLGDISTTHPPEAPVTRAKRPLISLSAPDMVNSSFVYLEIPSLGLSTRPAVSIQEKRRKQFK